jgi:hypothetical protein
MNWITHARTQAHKGNAANWQVCRACHWHIHNEDGRGAVEMAEALTLDTDSVYKKADAYAIFAQICYRDISVARTLRRALTFSHFVTAASAARKSGWSIDQVVIELQNATGQSVRDMAHSIEAENAAHYVPDWSKRRRPFMGYLQDALAYSDTPEAIRPHIVAILNWMEREQ